MTLKEFICKGLLEKETHNEILKEVWIYCEESYIICLIQKSILYNFDKEKGTECLIIIKTYNELPDNLDTEYKDISFFLDVDQDTYIHDYNERIIENDIFKLSFWGHNLLEPSGNFFIK